MPRLCRSLRRAALKLTTSRKHICPECQDKRDQKRRTTKRAAVEVRADIVTRRATRAYKLGLTDITRFYESLRRTTERKLEVASHKNMLHATTRRQMAVLEHSRFLERLDKAFMVQLSDHIAGEIVTPLSDYFDLAEYFPPVTTEDSAVTPTDQDLS